MAQAAATPLGSLSGVPVMFEGVTYWFSTPRLVAFRPFTLLIVVKPLAVGVQVEPTTDCPMG